MLTHMNNNRKKKNRILKIVLKSHFLYSKGESLSAWRRGATHGEGPGAYYLNLTTAEL